MQISRMIDMILIKLAKQKERCVLVEIKTYKKDKRYKSYRLTIENNIYEFKNQTELLLFLEKELM